LRHMKAEARADIDSRKHEGSFCRVGALLVDRQFPCIEHRVEDAQNDSTPNMSAIP
jgi:hypothetical protein